MSYNARLRAVQNRVSATTHNNSEQTLNSINGRKYHGWEVGSSQAPSIGIPSRLVRKVSERTTQMTITDGMIVGNTKNLVVMQNTLSGVGINRSQFNTNTASQSRGGIKSIRYYLGDTGGALLP